jgi:hypothetical protein
MSDLELLAQAMAGEDEDVWHRMSPETRANWIGSVRRGLASLEYPPAGLVARVASRALDAVVSLNAHEAERVARAALAALAEAARH